MSNPHVAIECGNCGGLIDLELHTEEGALTDTREVAVTCDCGKTQWLALTPILGRNTE